jgi:hypothetical protein
MVVTIIDAHWSRQLNYQPGAVVPALPRARGADIEAECLTGPVGLNYRGYRVTIYEWGYQPLVGHPMVGSWT